MFPSVSAYRYAEQTLSLPTRGTERQVVEDSSFH